MPVPSKRERCRRRLLKAMGKILREVEQIRIDLEWWNANRTEHPPEDFEGEIVVLPMIKQVIAHLEADENVPQDLWDRMWDQLEANAEGGGE